MLTEETVNIEIPAKFIIKKANYNGYDFVLIRVPAGSGYDGYMTKLIYRRVSRSDDGLTLLIKSAEGQEDITLEVENKGDTRHKRYHLEPAEFEKIYAPYIEEILEFRKSAASKCDTYFSGTGYLARYEYVDEDFSIHIGWFVTREDDAEWKYGLTYKDPVESEKGLYRDYTDSFYPRSGQYRLDMQVIKEYRDELENLLCELDSIGKALLPKHPQVFISEYMHNLLGEETVGSIEKDTMGVLKDAIKTKMGAVIDRISLYIPSFKGAGEELERIYASPRTLDELRQSM